VARGAQASPNEALQPTPYPAWLSFASADERRQRISEGKSRFVDWETAKTDIRRKLS